MVKTPATCCGPFELRRQAFLRLWIHHHMPSLPKDAHRNSSNESGVVLGAFLVTLTEEDDDDSLESDDDEELVD